MAQTRTWGYRLYRTASGRRIIEEFYRKLARPCRKKCYIYLARARDAKLLSVPRNICEKMERNLWEVKPEYGGTEYRFLVGWVATDLIGIVAAEVKKSPRLPRRVIDLAQKRVGEMASRVAEERRQG